VRVVVGRRAGTSCGPPGRNSSCGRSWPRQERPAGPLCPDWQQLCRYGQMSAGPTASGTGRDQGQGPTRALLHPPLCVGWSRAPTRPTSLFQATSRLCRRTSSLAACRLVVERQQLLSSCHSNVLWSSADWPRNFLHVYLHRCSLWLILPCLSLATAAAAELDGTVLLGARGSKGGAPLQHALQARLW
jgi:hypothetical protein